MCFLMAFLSNRKDQQSQELKKLEKVMFKEKEIAICPVLKENIKALKMMLMNICEKSSKLQLKF